MVMAGSLLGQCFLQSAAGTIDGPYTLPVAEVGVPYRYQFQVTGTAGPFRMGVQSATRLPSGMELSLSGELRGTPTFAVSEHPFDILLGGSNYQGLNHCQFKITVIANRLAISMVELPVGRVGTSYSANLRAGGGREPYRYELVSGTFPPGTLLYSNGVISGMPTTAGTFAMRVRVTDGNGNRAEGSISVTIAAAGLQLDTAALPAGEVGVAYTGAIRVVSGTATMQVLSGQLPIGLALAGSGAITGTPQTSGDFPFTVRATAGTAMADGSFNIRIAASSRPLSLSDWANPRFTVGLAASQQIPTLGGSGNLRFTLLEGTTPAGMSVSATGVFGGTPRRAGTYDQRWRVTDSAGATAERAYRLVVDAPRSLPDATAGQRYSHRETGTVTAASKLPLGLRLDPDGTITGTPFAAGIYQFTLRVDANTLSYQLRVAAPVTELAIETIDLPAAQRGRAYRQALRVDRAERMEGDLPPGLAWNGATIEGTPTQEGTWEFLLDLRSGSRSTSRRYAITVGAPGGPVLDAVVSSASYQTGAVAPGEILTLFGEALDGARVRINGVATPLLYALPRQASFVMPFSASGEAELWLERSGVESIPLRLAVVGSRPALYTLDGTAAAALYPAPRVVVLFGTGLGVLDAPVVDGATADAANLARIYSSGALKAIVDGGREARILYAGAAPGLIHGVAQINVEIPEGSRKLKLVVGTRESAEVELNY